MIFYYNYNYNKFYLYPYLSLRATVYISAHYAIARPSVRLSVCLSHGWISQKRL